ncbi:MAG: DUF3012 domain-containing protein [Gammaproteobacteria bacterium]|nr:MAG: DUF3012 domain-containing protein [Gammaproteobacteria bacterium]
MGVAGALLYATSCAPELGSDEWCNHLMDKPRQEWTAAEVKGVARHCIAPG